MKQKTHEHLIAFLLILIGVAVRLLPHPANFTPVTAVALFSGAVLSPGMALTVPLLAMMASDILIGPHPLFWLVWGCFFLTVFIGFRVKRSRGVSPVLFGTLAGSVLFFIVTNLGVFLFQNMYPKNYAGLLQCYTMALPFFRNSLLGDLFYSGVLFGIYQLVRKTVIARSETTKQSPRTTA